MNFMLDWLDQVCKYYLRMDLYRFMVRNNSHRVIIGKIIKSIFSKENKSITEAKVE